MRTAGVLLLTTWFFLGQAFAESPPSTVKQVVENVRNVYSKHCCFRALFDQLTVNVSMDLKDKFQGIMYVKKPGHIMLDVQAPEKQQVLIEGRSYNVYFPSEGSISKGEIPPELNLEHFFGFFANIGRLDENFLINFPAKAMDTSERLIFLELTDKKNPSGTYNIMVGIDSDNYTVRRAIIYDALGNYNRFDLSAIKFLESIPDSQFQIMPNAAEAPASAPSKLDE
jgi:outer membrane lipoprotein-sorting protein